MSAPGHLVVVGRAAQTAVERLLQGAPEGRRVRLTHVDDVHAIGPFGTADCAVVDAAMVAHLAAVRPDQAIVALLEGDSCDEALAALAAGADECLSPGEVDASAFVRAVALAVARHAANLEVRDRLLHDPLTGLPNRTLLDDRMAHALATIARHPGDVAVLFIDLDGFKDVNDRHGHHVGDAVLAETARRLRATVRPSDTVARYGGDEFVVLCEMVTHDEVSAIVARLRDELSRPLCLDGTVLVIRPSLGVAVADEPAILPAQLLGLADADMYRAKRAAQEAGHRRALMPMGGD